MAAEVTACGSWGEHAPRARAARLVNNNLGRNMSGSRFFYKYLKRIQKRQQRSALPGIERQNLLLRGARFTAMPEHGFEQVARTAVMQKLGVTAERLCQADATQRRGTPVAAAGLELGSMVGQAFPHVMQQQVAVGANHLIGQLGFCGVGRRGVFRGVTGLTAGLEKQSLARQYFGGIDVTS